MKNKIQNFFKGLFLQSMPAGPLSAKLNNLSHSSDGYFWMRADPIRLEADHQRVFMRGFIEWNLEKQALASLMNELNALLAQDNLVLIYLTSSEWLIKGRIENLKLPKFTELNPVSCLNQDIKNLLPVGDNQAYWCRLFTECQMIMQQYTNNSLWFWGAGVTR